MRQRSGRGTLLRVLFAVLEDSHLLAVARGGRGLAGGGFEWRERLAGRLFGRPSWRVEVGAVEQAQDELEDLLGLARELVEDELRQFGAEHVGVGHRARLEEGDGISTFRRRLSLSGEGGHTLYQGLVAATFCRKAFNSAACRLHTTVGVVRRAWKKLPMSGGGGEWGKMGENGGQWGRLRELEEEWRKTEESSLR